MSIKPGIYNHYKGNEYRVHFVARHSETLEDYVIYEPLYESESLYWVRPLKMFCENVIVDGKEVPRFQFMREE